MVVLPEPCRPHIIRTVTSLRSGMRRIDRAHQVDELLVDDADDLLARVEVRAAPFRRLPSETRAMKSLATGS